MSVFDDRDDEPEQFLVQLSKIMEELGKIVTDLGLEMQTFALIPNPDPTVRPMIQTIMILDPATAFVSKEQRDTDKQFEEIRIQMHAEEQRQKILDAQQATKDSLRDLIDGGSKGIGLDDLE